MNAARPVTGLAAAFGAACAMTASAAEARPARVAVIVYDGVLTSDVTAPLEVFGAASKKSMLGDVSVTTISIDADRDVITEEGLKLQADQSLTDGGDFEAVIVPSSYSMGPIVRNETLRGFVTRHTRQGAWIASNCSGARVLAAAGLLNGRNATTWAGGEAAFQRDYPAVRVQVDRNVVVDGRFITSNGGVVSYEAALTLLAAMTSPATAAEIAQDLQAPRMAGAEFPARADPVSNAAFGVAGGLIGVLLAWAATALGRKKRKQ
ncbi:MAG: DJ-1/PfpI family protein [Pseudomonadota bacterium]